MSSNIDFLALWPNVPKFFLHSGYATDWLMFGMPASWSRSLIQYSTNNYSIFTSTEQQSGSLPLSLYTGIRIPDFSVLGTFSNSTVAFNTFLCQICSAPHSQPPASALPSIWKCCLTSGPSNIWHEFKSLAEKMQTWSRGNEECILDVWFTAVEVAKACPLLKKRN